MQKDVRHIGPWAQDAAGDGLVSIRPKKAYSTSAEGNAPAQRRLSLATSSAEQRIKLRSYAAAASIETTLAVYVSSLKY